MGHIVQYAASSATYLHKRLQREGRALAKGGGGGKKSITDGYIVSVRASKDGSITKVLDVPAQLLVHRPTTFGGLTRAMTALVVGDRDLYAVHSKIDLADPPVYGLGPTRAIAYSGYCYVGYDIGVPGLSGTSARITNAATAQLLVYGGWHATLENIGLGRDEGHIVLQGGGWSVPSVAFGESILIEPRAAAEHVVVIPEQAIREASGIAALTMASRSLATATYSVGVAHACDSEGAHYVVADAQDFSTGRDIYLVIGKITEPAFDPELRERPAVFDWLSVVARPDVVAPQRALGSYGIGVHVGAVVTAGHLYSWDIGTGAPSGYDERRVAARVHALDPLSGDIAASVTLFDYNAAAATVKPLIEFFPSSAPGLVSVTRDYVGAGVVNNVRLTVWLGTAPLTSNMHSAGWAPWGRVLRGSTLDPVIAGSPVVNISQPFRFVEDIGGGMLAVVACQYSDYAGSASIPWHLIIVDAATLDFIEDRGLIAAYAYSAASTQSVSISVVTPQVVAEGVVTTPCVLLATVTPTLASRYVQISNDGGITWRQIASGFSGEAFYIGNKLHPVEISKAL